MDIYSNFEHLCQHEGESAFEIELLDRQSPISIIAPHGGQIEPGTTELAQLIAGEKFNFYSFTACKERNSPDLHITSHNFDEPQCLALINRSQSVLTIHGFKSESEQIYVGGLDTPLRQAILLALSEAGFPAADDHPKYQGINPANICNRGLTGRGVQLELSRHFRNNQFHRQEIALAIQLALQT